MARGCLQERKGCKTKEEMNSVFSFSLRLVTIHRKPEDRTSVKCIYLNANESKGALIVDKLSSKIGEVAADSLAADLIALELKHRPI